MFGLAGLLHDIGHYPFSHAMEDALQEFHSKHLVVEEEPNDTDTREGESKEPIPPAPLDHVRLGKEILINDSEFAKWLSQYDINAEDVAEIFARESRDPLVSLISSDLDADRIDFLLRTAHHTGLPYGHVDLEYVLSHLSRDSEERLALHQKALRTVDHLLLCRFFDYQQVVFQKTVRSLEELLKEVLIDLVRLGRLPWKPEQVITLITDGSWRQFDDVHVMSLIREFAKEAPDEESQLRAQALVNRTPPRQVFEEEFLDKRDSLDGFNERRDELRALLPQWAEEFRIPEGHWWVWGKSATLTSTIPVPQNTDPEEFMSPDDYAKAVRILERDERTSLPITDDRASLMHVLGENALYAMRIFLLLPANRQDEREGIERRVLEDVTDRGLL